MLTIQLLGKVHIFYNGESLEDQMSTKQMAIVCLLALSKGHEMSKERLAAYLSWHSNALCSDLPGRSYAA